MKFDPENTQSSELYGTLYNLAVYVEGECARSLTKSVETELRRAISQILPNTFSILHGLNSLISEGHLFGAELLLRPLLERVALISYLAKSGPDPVRLWSEGWVYSKRPNIRTMIETIEEPDIDLSKYGVNQTSLRTIFLEMVDEMNSIVHPNPSTANRNAVSVDGGQNWVLYTGANQHNKVYIDNICLTALGLVSALVQELGNAMPEIKPQGQKA